MNLTLPVICLITDRTLCTDLAPVVAQAVHGGVNMVQVREKDLPTRELLALTQRLEEVIGDRAQLMVNGRADIAFAASAAGVHLSSEGLPAGALRDILPGAIVGRSVHTESEMKWASEEPLDYLELGTVYPSRSHPAGPALGVVSFRRLVAGSSVAARLPVIAVGGITPQNAAEVIEAGAAGVAVISSILAAADPRAAAEDLGAAVRLAWEQRRSVTS
jgi:thiamine-phosphate diphosphorylase